MRPFRIYLSLLLIVTAILVFPAPQQDDPTLPELGALLPHLDEVPQRQRVLGYERTVFGAGWAPTDGCTVREAVLADAGGTFTDCRVTAGTGVDPYTGDVLDLRGDVEIDHVLPLSAAWDLGAHRWDRRRREAFANDPLNLLATSRTSNREKSDHLPGAWLPEDASAHCRYVRRLALVAVAHELPLPAEDLRVMRKACRRGASVGDWLGWTTAH